MIYPNLAILKCLFIFAFAPNKKKRLSQSWIFFVGAGKKQLEICQKRGQREKTRKREICQREGVGDEAGGSLHWPQ
jgi:hypothetical protein